MESLVRVEHAEVEVGRRVRGILLDSVEKRPHDFVFQRTLLVGNTEILASAHRDSRAIASPQGGDERSDGLVAPCRAEKDVAQMIATVGMLGIDLEAASQVALGWLVTLLGQRDEAQMVVSVRVIRRKLGQANQVAPSEGEELRRSFQIPGLTRQCPSTNQTEAEVLTSRRVTRIDFQSGLKLIASRLIIGRLPPEERRSQVVVGFGESGIDGDRILEVSSGVVQVARTL